jgi:TRAP-type C4-dicarboxylate transport system substrate-binding protein
MNPFGIPDRRFREIIEDAAKRANEEQRKFVEAYIKQHIFEFKRAKTKKRKEPDK